MKKILLLQKDKLEKYKIDNIYNDILYIGEEKYSLYKINNNNYDLYVFTYDNEDDKNLLYSNIIDHVTNHSLDKDVIIYDKPEDVVFDNDFYFVLSVGSGEYEDYYERAIGIFKTRYKAEQYYKEHCEITLESIKKQNEEYYKYEENEPIFEDYNSVEDYNNAYTQYWSDKVCEYIPEDSATCCRINKLKIID